MKHYGVDDKRLAGRLGVSRVAVTRWRNSARAVSAENIARIAHALGINPPTRIFQLPEFESLDALVEDAPDDLRKTAVEVIQALIKRAG